MKKIVPFLVVMMALMNVSSNAQTATETQLDYQRGKKPAAMIELPYSPEIVEGALKKKLESPVTKEQRLKGMLVFKSARVTPSDGEVADFYFKVERKGKKEANTSTVYLILGRPNENVALRSSNDNFRIADAREFLNSIPPDVAAYKLETDIAGQEELVKKTEKTLQGLVNTQKNLEQRIQELQDRLAQNKRDQEKYNAELSQQRSLRDALNSKRVTTSN